MKNKEGMTLVEVMVALVIFLFVFLALMQTALVSIDANMGSALREESARIAEERMNDARSKAFNTTTDSLTIPWSAGGANDTSALSATDCPSPTFRGAHPTGVGFKRDVRSIKNFPFCTNSTVVYNIGGPFAQVTINVGWQWKGIDYTNTIMTNIKKVEL